MDRTSNVRFCPIIRWKRTVANPPIPVVGLTFTDSRDDGLPGARWVPRVTEAPPHHIVPLREQVRTIDLPDFAPVIRSWLVHRPSTGRLHRPIAVFRDALTREVRGEIAVSGD